MTAVISPTPPTGLQFRVIPLELIHESPFNPRKHFDEAKIDELAQSIIASGLLNPLLARPRAAGAGYELAAGHRRRRAAMKAVSLGGPNELPVIVREMSDAEFLEILVVENGQREDVHPLEEAEGYRALMVQIGYGVEKVAQRVGRHIDTVYDRLRLLQLVPEAKRLFLDHRFTLKHAIILARQPDEAQERAIKPRNDRGHYLGSMLATSGLWERESAHHDPLQEDLPRPKGFERDPYDRHKAVTPAELQTWFDDHVRLDLDQPDLDALHPEAAAAIVDAAESDTKIRKISFAHQLKLDARDASERTYSIASWKRADGAYNSKTCEFADIGVVVAGPRRGESFAVCVNRDKCKVHWAAERAARTRRRKQNGQAPIAERGETPAQKKAREKEAAALAAKAAEAARFETARDALRAEAEAAIEKISFPAMIAMLSKNNRLELWGRGEKEFAKVKNADQALRTLLRLKLENDLDDYLDDVLAELGFDVRKLLDKHAPIAKGGVA